MKSLYAIIEINRKMNGAGKAVVERVKYYKTKDELYGIEIVKDNNLHDENVNVQDILQITE